MNKIKLIGLIAIASATVVASAVLPLVSYIQYQQYFEGLDLNPGKKPTKPSDSEVGNARIVKFSKVALKEGHQFFKNRKADPTSDDFDVVAHYEGGGVEPFDNPLSHDQFTIKVPDDFYLNGGAIEFIANEGYSETHEFQLEDIKPSKIEVLSLPYKSNYGKGDKFDITGAKFTIVNNDSSSFEADYTEMKVDEVVLNEVGDSIEVPVKYAKDGVEITGNVPVKVLESLPAGTITSLTSDGVASIFAKQAYSSMDFSKINILGLDSNGNKQILKNGTDFKLVDTTTKANFGIKKVEIQNSDGSMKGEIPVVVKQKIEAESATLKDADKTIQKVASNYSFEKSADGSYVKNNSKLTYINGLTTKNTIKFAVNSDSDTKGKIYLRIANKNVTEDGSKVSPLALNKVTNINVIQATQTSRPTGVVKYTNYSYRSINQDTVIEGYEPSGEMTTSDIGLAFETIEIKDVSIYSGTTAFELVFHDDLETKLGLNFNLDWIQIEEDVNPTPYNLGDYFNNAVNKEKKPSVSKDEMVSSWKKGIDPFDSSMIPAGSVTHDGYLYMVHTPENMTKFGLAKYDLKDFSLVKKTEQVEIGEKRGADNYNCFYFRGMIGVIDSFYENKIHYYDAETLKPVEYNDIDFMALTPEGVGPDGVSPIRIQSIYFNESNNRAAVSYDTGVLDIYNFDGQKFIKLEYDKGNLVTFDKGKTYTLQPYRYQDYTMQGIWGSDDYIIGISSKNRDFGIAFTVYDWNGKAIKPLSGGPGFFSQINYTLKNRVDMFSRPGRGNLGTNIQNIFEKDGDLYVTLNSYDAMFSTSGAYFYKLDINYNFDEAVTNN